MSPICARTARGIRAVGLEAMDEAAVDEVYRRAKSEGLAILGDTPLLPKVKRAVRFATPFGPIFEVHTPIAREDIAPALTNGKRVRRLEHVNLRATDPRGFHDLVTRMLGMKLSDRTTQYERAWYRCCRRLSSHIRGRPRQRAASLCVRCARTSPISPASPMRWWRKGEACFGESAATGRATICFRIISIRMAAWSRCRSASSASTTMTLYEPGNWEFNSSSNVLDRWGSQPPESYGKAITPFVS